MNFKNINVAIKMILAGTVTLIIAYFLNITYYTTASAVSILSIQLTKIDFIKTALKRLISGLFAILLSAVMFYFIAQNFLVFSIFLTIFILTSFIFKIEVGIVASTVLVTHLLIAEEISIAFVGEEILLLVVALFVAFFFNMFYPESNKKILKKYLVQTDKIIESELIAIYSLLTNQKSNKSFNIEKKLNQLIYEAETVNKNIIIENDHRYTNYLYMRSMQLKSLIRIENEIKNLIISHQYQVMIAEFILEISKNISFIDSATYLLGDLNKLRDFFRNEPLPTQRYEFELRAVLFVILNELEQFLLLKIEFHKKYPNFIQESRKLK